MSSGSLHFHKSDVRWVCAMLALAILIGGAPGIAGVAIGGSAEPAFSLDLCHPLQAANVAVAPVLARPAITDPRPALPRLDLAPVEPSRPRTDLRFPPDTPPPKVLS